jgi:hypothetical protein
MEGRKYKDGNQKPEREAPGSGRDSVYGKGLRTKNAGNISKVY